MPLIIYLVGFAEKQWGEIQQEQLTLLTQLMKDLKQKNQGTRV